MLAKSCAFKGLKNNFFAISILRCFGLQVLWNQRPYGEGDSSLVVVGETGNGFVVKLDGGATAGGTHGFRHAAKLRKKTKTREERRRRSAGREPNKKDEDIRCAG
jgi:hypothetical protein